MYFNIIVDFLINAGIRWNTTHPKSIGLLKFSAGYRKLTIKTISCHVKSPSIMHRTGIIPVQHAVQRNDKLLLCVILSPLFPLNKNN